MALRLPCPPYKVNLIFINPLNFLVPKRIHSHYLTYRYEHFLLSKQVNVGAYLLLFSARIGKIQ